MKTRKEIGFMLIIAMPIVILCQYTPYFGNLHSHTSYSDGAGIPPEAYEYARNVGQIDFLAVTDHLEQIYYLPWRWTATKNAANDANEDGVFLAIAGYEWSCPLTNHVNVFNTPNMVTPLTYFNWSGFYNDVLEEYPAFAQFNHPGREALANDWNNFAFVSPTVDSAFLLIEVREFYQDSFYQMALDSGWHVSPVANQDNHSADWGTRNDSRAGIWAEELTWPSLVDAIRAGRTFSTFDKNARVWIEVDGTPMGSRITREERMRLYIYLHDPDDEGWDIVEVRASGNTALITLPPRTTNIDTTISFMTSDIKWLFVRACQPDGQWIWSAPVYLEDNPLGISEVPIAEVLSIEAYPNPFNSAVHFNAPEGSLIGIYDVYGRIIAQLHQGDRIWTPDSDVPSGIYNIRVTKGDAIVATGRVVYLK